MDLCGWSSWNCACHLKDGWLQDECCFRHLRAQEFPQDKTRREEDTSLSHSLTNLVEVLYSQKSIFNFSFQTPKHPFYNREGGSQMYKIRKLERSPSNSF